jgi:predicted SAM-dependent methyltransferase
VFEHLTRESSQGVWRTSFERLRPGGNLRIAVPDGFHCSEYNGQLTGIMGLEPGAEDHKEFWNYKTLSADLRAAGFDVKCLEYFDEKGVFHKNDWNSNGGEVERSQSGYRGLFTEYEKELTKLIQAVPPNLRFQFEGGELSYTSLIVDASKPV